MTKEEQQTYTLFNSTYFFIFFGMGALYPLLSVYFESLGLNGKQIGYLASIGPVVAILIQPTWGGIADRYQIPKQILILGLALISIISLLFPQFSSFWALFLLLILLNIFQSPLIPVLDNLSLNFTHASRLEYGNIRLWGSIGFALAAFFAGWVAEWTTHASIFYVYAIAMAISIIFVRSIPVQGQSARVQLGQGVWEVLRMPRFLLFLLSAFFVFGTMNANNTFFGIYYQHIGGTLAGIGFVFLLAASSEAPFMRLGGRLIARLGLENTLLLAAFISLIRWIIFSQGPGPVVVTSLFFLQGVSIGLYLTAAPQFVKQNTPKEIQVTAMAIYASFGHGLGTMFNNSVGGWIYDEFSIYIMYGFFALMTLLGILSIIFIKRMKPKDLEDTISGKV